MKTYTSPIVIATVVNTGSILAASVQSNDANALIDDLELDLEGNNKVTESSKVW